TSCSMKVTVPAATGANPVMALNSVDLPAPFGPIRPSICPWFKANETSLTATSPPNCTLMLSALSTVCIFLPGQLVHILAHDAARQQQDHHQYQHPIDQHIGLRKGRAKDFSRYHQQRGAHGRPPDRAASADDDRQRNLHG